jgi:hypothetical protein
MNYLGNYKITPNDKEIEVDCYGTIQPEEKQTLENSGCGRYVELLRVTTEVSNFQVVDITDYLSSDIWDELEFNTNNKY